VSDHPDAHGPDLRLADIVIEMVDGQRYETREEQMYGSVVNPASNEAIRAKMIDLSTAALPRSQVDVIIQTVEAIETLDDVGVLARMLVHQ
jgi:hypothetical protein